jgi:hypothetical protein
MTAHEQWILQIRGQGLVLWWYLPFRNAGV